MMEYVMFLLLCPFLLVLMIFELIAILTVADFIARKILKWKDNGGRNEKHR